VHRAALVRRNSSFSFSQVEPSRKNVRYYKQFFLAAHSLISPLLIPTLKYKEKVALHAQMADEFNDQRV
jgi:hypothetical protein